AVQVVRHPIRCRARWSGEGMGRSSTPTAFRRASLLSTALAAGLLAGFGAALAPGAGAQQPATWDDRDVAVLQGLDKITARVWTFEAAVGALVRFGTLDLTVEACKKRPPDEPPDSAAFVQVREMPADSGEAPLFRGWMFASSPALSALE